MEAERFKLTDRKIAYSKASKDIIKCVCGDEIAILPDVKATGEAIEIHVAFHVKGFKGQACTSLEAEQLRDALIAQILTIAGKSKDEETRR